MQAVATREKRPRIQRKLVYTTQMTKPLNDPVRGVVDYLLYVHKWSRLTDKPQSAVAAVQKYSTEVLVLSAPKTLQEVCTEIQKDFDKFKQWVKDTYK